MKSMDDRSRVLMSVCAGAVLGGLWGWLYLTSNGGQLRQQISPALDRVADTLDKVRSFLDTRERLPKSA